ncbi:unnamed protein product [Soboliphyme baturini]|uniref:Secreted protein n=1 Tax=Soboliphyme baturini TaxID=241478 RepID=A0A183IRZ0_9BILA|nr:unnamed protein product [Soboliphyme baturini]
MRPSLRKCSVLCAKCRIWSPSYSWTLARNAVRNGVEMPLKQKTFNIRATGRSAQGDSERNGENRNKMNPFMGGVWRDAAVEFPDSKQGILADHPLAPS